MASTTSVSSSTLPSGGKIFTTAPDIFFLPEWVFGGLVWILVASTRVYVDNPQGWVMFVSVFCFVFTTIWFLVFASGCNKNSVWFSLDVGYHFVAAVFYLSASVALASTTLDIGVLTKLTVWPTGIDLLKIYRLDIAAVVMSYVATLLYFIHAILSAIRWKSS